MKKALLGPKLWLFFLTFSLGLMACTKKGSSPSLDVGPAGPACDQLNVVRDASWTSGFVKSFVSCLSEGNESSRAKFALTLDVLNRLGDQSLQSALDLFRFEFEGKDVFFGLSSSFLDRGAPDQSPQRWVATQAVLEDTKPYAFLRLMMELKRRDLLNPLLDTLQSADDTLPKGLIETAVRQFLNDEQVKADTITLIQSFLADEEAFVHFNAFLTPHRKVLDASCTSDCVYPGSNELKSSAQHWLDFWSGLPAAQRDRLALAMAQLMKGSLEQDDRVAMDRGQDLLELSVDAVTRSDNVYGQVYDALNVILDTPLSSYEPFIQGLNRIKDNPIYLDAFQEKIGSSQVQDLVLEFLWKGGQPKSCSTVLPGLSSASDKEKQSAILRELLNAHPACESKSPVLVYLSQVLGYECANASCSINLLQVPEAADFAKLLDYHWTETEDELRTDSFYLYRLGASRAELSAVEWTNIRAAAKDARFQSAADLLVFEKTMQRQFPRLLSNNWLELSLNQTLLKLSQVEQSFKGVHPDRDPIEQWYYPGSNGSGNDADTQLVRLVYGLYKNGSADQILSRLFQLDTLEKAWRSSHPESKVKRRDLAQMVAPLRSLGSLFRNPSASFKPEAEKIALPWLGSVKNVVSFDKSGLREKASGQVVRQTLLFDESETGLSLRSRYKEQLALASASVPEAEADELRRWLVDDYISARMQDFEVYPIASGLHFPLGLFDRQPLSAVEARTLTLFLGTQFSAELSELPENATVSPSPETNVNPKTEGPRAYFGPSALGGTERPWTSFWLMQNNSLSADRKSLSALREDLVINTLSIRQSFVEKASAPTLLSQGLLDVTDADKLNEHEKLLVQLHLMSPILENRGKQYFVPAIGMDAYCPRKNGQTWSGTTCPFSFEKAADYEDFIVQRFTKAFCAALPRESANLAFALQSMGLNDTTTEVARLCARSQGNVVWKGNSLEGTLIHALQMGKNPRLKESVKAIPAQLHWLKVSQELSDPKEQLKSFLSVTPVMDGLTSAKIEQRMGIYRSFFSRQPPAISTWMLYLSRDIGLRGLTESLKKLGSQPVGGSQTPVQDFLSLIANQYAQSMELKDSNLEFVFKLLTEVAKHAYARDTMLRILGKPYDPYAGILMGYTIPQAVKAGILPEFSWKTYAPLRLLLQNENLDLLQGLAAVYDRDAALWLNHWLKLSENFPNHRVLANDLRPLLQWVRAFAKTRDLRAGEELKTLLSMRDWSPATKALTRHYRLLRVSLPDLSNQWHDAYYFESAALSRTLVETLPRLLTLKDRFELSGGDNRLMVDAFLGIIQGPLKHDSKELSLWLQDERMGFRAPSYWGAALRDVKFRKDLDSALAGFDMVSLAEWKQLRSEWDTLGPHSSHLIQYTADNVVLRSDKARQQKDALQSLARVTTNPDRWRELGLTLDAWLDDRSVLTEWQTKGN